MSQLVDELFYTTTHAQTYLKKNKKIKMPIRTPHRFITGQVSLPLEQRSHADYCHISTGLTEIFF